MIAVWPPLWRESFTDSHSLGLARLRRKAAAEVVRVLQGGKPVNLLNPEVEPR